MTAVLVSRNKAPLPGIVNEFENFTKAGVSCWHQLFRRSCAKDQLCKDQRGALGVILRS
jgi:hypothetical protein